MIHSPSSIAPSNTNTKSSLSSSKTHANPIRKVSIDKIPFNPNLESLPLSSIRGGGMEKTDTFAHETFTLPHKTISGMDSRGVRPYSSARYTSSTIEANMYRKCSKVARHGSFQGSADGHIQVSPMVRDPLGLSEENSDILESLSYYKVSEFPSSNIYRVNSGGSDNMLEDSPGQATMVAPSESQVDPSLNNLNPEDNNKWDSLKRSSRARDINPPSTALEIDSDKTNGVGTTNQTKAGILLHNCSLIL